MSIRNRRPRKNRYQIAFESLEERLVLSSPEAAPSLGPPPAPSSNVIWVNSDASLQSAINDLQSGQTIVIQKGTYKLSNTLYIGKNHQVTDVTIRGETDNFNDVVLLGNGMDNARYGNVPMGISVYNAQNVTIAALSIGQIYYHPIELAGPEGASQVDIYHTRLFDAGEQFIKSNPTSAGGGVDNSSVKYSLIEYTAGPPKTDHGGGIGYTNGIDVHGGKNWEISDNLIRNLHVPDSVPSNNLWNPAILIWNNAANVTVQRNTIIDCDRAIAMGLIQRSSGYDAQNGIIQNNVVYITPGLFSAARKADADGQILAWSAPGTVIAHNTILTNGNVPNSIQTRWAASGIQLVNNLSDAPARARDNSSYAQSGNYWAATSTMFVDTSAGDLRLVSGGAAANVIDKVDAPANVTVDWSGNPRTSGARSDIGAFEYQTTTPTPQAPTVTSTTPSSGTTGVVASSIVSATFSQSMQASSIGFTLKDATGKAVASTLSYDDGSRTATLALPLLSPSTTYTATVSAGTSSQGVALASPVTWSFTTAAASSTSGTRTQTTAADFGSGTVSGTVVTSTGDGEVQLAPAISDSFNGSSLGSGWTTRSWGSGSGYSVSGGSLALTGAQVLSRTSYNGGVPVQARLNFGSAAYLHFGLATDLVDARGNSWAIFSTMGTTNTLYARVNSNGVTSDVRLGSIPSGFHTYQVVPVSGGFQFLIDGSLKATINRSISSRTPLRVAFSSYQSSSSTALLADSIQVDALTSTGTFTSSSLDAGANAVWGTLSWTATTPSGSSIVVETSSSPNGSTWSSWASVSNGGTIASPSGRYLRYRVTFATTSGGSTPVLSAITVNWDSSSETPPDGGDPPVVAPTVTSTSPTSSDSTASAGTTVSATFDKSIVASSVVLTVQDTSGNQVEGTLSYNASTRTVVFAPSAPLAASTTYTATVSGATDESGNTMPSPFTWTFKTAAAPSVTSMSPTTGATGVSRTATATATFSQAMQASSIVFTLKNSAGATVPATLSYDARTLTATLTPSSPLESGMTYTATLSGGMTVSGFALSTLVTWTFTIASASTPPTGQEQLLYQQNLQYVGAFRVPGGQIGSSVFDYGGSALAFNPANNSLFMVGHSSDQAVAEVAIPSTILNTTDLSRLSVAKVLQPFTSILPRLPNNPSNMSVGGQEAIGGLMVVDGQLIGTAFNTYDGSASVNVSHFKLSSTNLASANVSGLYQVGNMGGGFVGGYMAPIPSEWQSALGAPYLTGQAALNIISRTSSGPAAFGFDPAKLGQGVTPAIPYVYYDQNHPTLGAYGSNAPTLFNGTVGSTGLVSGMGVAFVPGSRSVLFFSSIGTGDYYYGEASDANDPNRVYKGPHSVGGGYTYKVWAYDVNDFVAVKSGQKNPWDLKPYSTWDFSFPVPSGPKYMGGVAFDPSTNRLYFSELKMERVGDPYASRPLIHVFQLTLNNQQSSSTSDAMNPSLIASSSSADQEVARSSPSLNGAETQAAARPLVAMIGVPTSNDSSDVTVLSTADDVNDENSPSSTESKSSNDPFVVPSSTLAEGKYSRWYRIKKPGDSL